jgi:CO/xanthine dehydrogenase FAD-binding subunit
VDLHTVRAIHRPRGRAELAALLGAPDTAVLAGGTWLFSEPQDHLAELVDLTGLGWPALSETPTGLRVAATCTLAELAAYPHPLFRRCCRALAGSFKIWHTATVGGNVCLALPAGPITSLAAGLGGTAVLWSADGERRVPVADFVTDVRSTVITPGEVLRAVDLPGAALAGRTAFRRAALTPEGRSGAVLVGLRCGEEAAARELALTITASTTRPHRFTWPDTPGSADLDAALAGIGDWYADPHGAADWRAHVTGRLAREIVEELA